MIYCEKFQNKKSPTNKCIQIDKPCIQMDTLPECLKWHNKSQHVLKTEISVFSQMVIFKKKRKEHPAYRWYWSCLNHKLRDQNHNNHEYESCQWHQSPNPWKRNVEFATCIQTESPWLVFLNTQLFLTNLASLGFVPCRRQGIHDERSGFRR